MDAAAPRADGFGTWRGMGVSVTFAAYECLASNLFSVHAAERFGPLIGEEKVDGSGEKSPDSGVASSKKRGLTNIAKQ